MVGSPVKVPACAAALANGTISHALDYDDTHFADVGNLSVGIMPAALALGEALDASAAAVRDAFLVGAEAACRIGTVLGRRHYDRGFHQTATAGAFGATVASGRLLGLSVDQMRHALSLVGTCASGLKSHFGTMGEAIQCRRGGQQRRGGGPARPARPGFLRRRPRWPAGLHRHPRRPGARSRGMGEAAARALPF